MATEQPQRRANPETETYALFGLSIATTLPLPCRRTSEPPDVVISVDPPGPIGDEPSPGTVLADYVKGEVRWYSLSEQSSIRVMRLPGICDLTVSADGSRARFTPAAGVTDDMLAIMLAGTGVSTLLTLIGSTVLHGSAVERDSVGLAFLGDSGQGKSTLTSLFCTAGWRLLCDDVLRVDQCDQTGAGRFVCFPGSCEIRLRDRAPFDPTWPSRTTVDQRRAVSPPSADLVTPVEALIIPFPNRQIDRVEGHRLSAVEAVPRLVHYSRIGGWKDNTWLGATFSGAVEVAQAVPVWEVEVPWDDRLDTDVAGQLAALVL